MRWLSDGSPSTLGTYRAIALAIAGEGSDAVMFFDKKIAESPLGKNEEVVADEMQVLCLIGSMLKGGD